MNKTEIAKQLKLAQENIKERRARIAQHTEHRREPLPQDFSEQAVELENDETMVALEQELDAESKKIQQALQRLEEGTYALCESCGETIDPDRRQALPSTTVCINCAE